MCHVDTELVVNRSRVPKAADRLRGGADLKHQPICLRVWDVEDEREVCTLTEDAMGVETVCIAANGKTVISAHGDKRHLGRVDPILNSPKSSNYGDHFEQIVVAANGGRIVIATGNGRMEVWNGDSYSVVTPRAAALCKPCTKPEWPAGKYWL